MRLLIDTHAFLWFAEGDRKLSDFGRDVVADMRNDVLLSVASIWEIATKAGLGKIELSGPFEPFVQRELSGFQVLPISTAHAIHVATLPHHHRDPFDRMLIAQSLIEGLPVLSNDRAFDVYGVERIWSG